MRVRASQSRSVEISRDQSRSVEIGARLEALWGIEAALWGAEAQPHHLMREAIGGHQWSSSRGTPWIEVQPH